MDRNTAYETVLEEQRNLLESRKRRYEKSVQEKLSGIQEYKDIKYKISKVASELYATVFSDDVKHIEYLKKEFSKLNEAKNAIEKSAVPEPFKYDCNICNDTGYVEGKLCSCVRNKANNLILKDISANVPLDECTFENFDLNFYEETAKNGTSPKKRMTAIFKMLREYAIKFNPRESENILLTGGTGLGKTHLSLAVFKELVLKEYDVLYFSSFNLFSKIENEHFNLHTNSTYENVLNCDLLIIDDLGSEFASPYCQSVFYNIVNTRILSGKPTIINTNLSMSEIESKYSARVSSRLIGHYNANVLLGTDIRQKKVLLK